MAIEPDAALTGAAFDLANAGYRPMPDLEEKREDEAIDPDSASLREAAAQRSGPRNEPIVREYLDADGLRAAPNEAVTLQRAARDYASAAAADVLAAEGASADELAARVDAIRAGVLSEDPGAAEFYGFEL